MPIDSSPSSVATTALQGIPFSSLIGAPLNAAIDAQAKAAKSTYDFIQGVGLTGPENDRRPIQVEFLYYVDGKETKLVVPLLTIVPIPYLAIDEVDIRFKANIKAEASTYQEDNSSTEDTKSGGGSGSVGWGPWKAQANFSANYSSKKDSKATQQSKYSVEYTMDVHVHASQEDIPAGLAKVLGILEQSITPTQTHGTIRFSPERLQITGSADETFTVRATAYDNQGRRIKNQEFSFTNDKFEIVGSKKTDENGEAVLTFKCKQAITDPNQRKDIKLGLTVGDVKKDLDVSFTKALPASKSNAAPSV
ncbi:DUF2589 domain-containing protein [Nostoc sp. CHAB 5844]|nr:DUF2589 domain-containing protein [Nostoc sp. CHAB 5844]